MVTRYDGSVEPLKFGFTQDVASMCGRAKLFLLSTIAVILSTRTLLKGGPQNSAPDSDLKVRIILDKTTFALHEKVYARIEFKNSGSKTYCFPKPTRDCTNDYPGSVVTTGHAVSVPGDFERFICHFDSGGPRAGDLESEIKQHWIKVAPNAVYLSEKAEAIVDLNTPGEWQLETTYWQPQAAFNSARVEKILTSAAEKVGCAIPKEQILSGHVTIHVVAATKDHL